MSFAALGLPRRYWLFVSAEMAERASFIGVATILAGYASGPLALAPANAALLVSAFFATTYLAPMLGGWASDRGAGPWPTLLAAGAVCLLGHLLLGTAPAGPAAIGQSVAGLGLIALGAGAIKAVAPVLAGQAAAGQSGRIAPEAFGVFYAAINVAALAASLAMPLLRDLAGYGVALLMPMLVLGLALALLWRLRPPRRAPLAALTPGRLPPILLRLLPALSLYYLVLYQGYASWVLFIGREIDLRLSGFTIPPEAFLAINPLVVICLSPLLDGILRRHLPPDAALHRPATRIQAGLLLAGVGPALMAMAALLAVDGGRPGPWWPALATMAMAIAEVFVAVSALRLAAGADDPAARGRATGLFYLAIAAGNILGGLLVGILEVPIDAGGFALQAGLLVTGALLARMALRDRTVGAMP